MDKHQRYRKKMKKLVLCPHCGKPCEPFFECAERRENKRKQRTKNKYKVNPVDVRKIPRIEHIPAVYYKDFMDDPVFLKMGIQEVIKDFLE